jgi:hypothetical protein
MSYTEKVWNSERYCVQFKNFTLLNAVSRGIAVKLVTGSGSAAQETTSVNNTLHLVSVAHLDNYFKVNFIQNFCALPISDSRQMSHAIRRFLCCCALWYGGWLPKFRTTIPHSTLKMKAARFSETLISNHHNTSHSNPKIRDFYLHLRENPKSQMCHSFKKCVTFNFTEILIINIGRSSEMLSVSYKGVELL